MKVVEIRNMYIDYRIKESGTCSRRESGWATFYIMKQILRLIEIKSLKNAMTEIDLWTPETVVKTLRNISTLHTPPKSSKKGP